jgi:hypothetical protein
LASASTGRARNTSPASASCVHASSAEGLGRFVAAVLRGACVDAALAAQPPHHAVAHALGYPCNVALRGRRRFVEVHAAVVGLVEAPVDAEGVDMRVDAKATSTSWPQPAQ